MLGRAELAVIALSKRCYPIHRMADPNPARSKNIPPDQAVIPESV